MVLVSPQVVCKYIQDPVLFLVDHVGLVKFDLRFMVLLRSVRPLKLYVYNVFWLRFANREFSLDHFDDYEKHFTVMNYTEGATLTQIHYDEFIPMFEQQYPQHPWRNIQVSTHHLALSMALCSSGAHRVRTPVHALLLLRT
uniref:Uncharacterized protein n=1 Tax=Knipowitschia caucasica TaxID=637954 RepID=A0AAV2IQ46_KNICA